MRGTWLLALALIAAPAAGCLSGDSEEAARTQPSEIHDERTVDLAVEPQGEARGTPCEGETARCFVYTFDAPQATAVDAELAWTSPANDLDLYLYPYAEDDALAQATRSGPETGETLQADLDPGTYRLVVAAELAAQDTYTLDVVFPQS